MSDNKYNGWTNRETWLVNLHFGDDEYTLKQFVNDAEGDAWTVAKYLEEMVSDYVSEVLGNVSGFVADLINLNSINWYELADGYVENYWNEPEEEEEEEETE